MVPAMAATAAATATILVKPTVTQNLLPCCQLRRNLTHTSPMQQVPTLPFWKAPLHEAGQDVSQAVPPHV
eukprot:CAMPEP_0172680566 /NCGR_PEP_ID=MMETSP1074-20121228/16854_1 /TAXON_ID=2916 /ORGANISM="Ceratium fusus, Strain PA161109" /LENGTH=69 /DNA_ID=CAMNT_0013498917 /DNA_START=235 /DNA_END=444 /DNA_ORIENTATION=+